MVVSRVIEYVPEAGSCTKSVDVGIWPRLQFVGFDQTSSFHTAVHVLSKANTEKSELLFDGREPDVAVSVYPWPTASTVKSSKMAMPLIAGCVTDPPSSAPDVPEPGVIVNVTLLLDELTVIPALSWTTT